MKIRSRSIKENMIMNNNNESVNVGGKCRKRSESRK
jgi:hypothetical protein